jgi:hypothetical protein
VIAWELTISNAEVKVYYFFILMDFFCQSQNSQPYICQILPAQLEYFGIKENFIVTYNQEKEFHEQGISVKAIPAWKWMLDLA